MGRRLTLTLPAIVSLAKKKLSQNYLIYLIIFTYTIVFSLVSIVKHRSFSSTAWDLGIHEQALWSTVNSGTLFWSSPELPINPGGCFFGIHFSPILFLILPIYWIFQTTETLLILQSFFLALGALPLYWIAQKQVTRMTSLLFVVVFILYPPMQAMNLVDFHVQAFLPTFFLFALHYFRERQWGKYFFFVILALMTIEFVPFHVIFLGLYGLWIKRNALLKINSSRIKKLLVDKGILCPVITIFLGIFWFVLARRITLYFNPSPRPHPNWQEFGDPVYSPVGLLWTIISNPLHTLRVLICVNTIQKIEYLVRLLAPLAFLSFFDLPSLMIGTPWFAAAFLSTDYPTYYQATGAQYVAFVIPFIFVSALNGTQRFIAIIKQVGSRKGWRSPIAITTKRAFTVMIFISVLFLATLGAQQEMVHITLRNRTLEKVINLIPADAAVLTQNDIFSHVCRRTEAYVGGVPWQETNYSSRDVDYIIVDSDSKWYQNDLIGHILDCVKKGEFGVVTAVDGIWLLKKNYTGKPAFKFENWVLENGILGEFYNNESPESGDSPAFISAFLDTEWGWTPKSLFPTVNNNSFSLILSASLKAVLEGEYEFKIADNASMLKIDDKVFQEFVGDIEPVFLQKGIHRIEIEYTNLKAYGRITLLWKTPKTDTFDVIPNANLYLPVGNEQ